MIVSALTGGLGNQLFQYAVGYAASKRRRTGLRLDLRHYLYLDPAFPSRPYALHQFAISAKPMSEIDRAKVDRVCDVDRFAVRMMNRLGLPRMQVISDEAEGHDARIRESRGDAYVTGLWQSERHFAEYRSELIEEFRFKQKPSKQNEELLQAIGSSNAIAIHFRRTDYMLESTVLKPCSLDYYDRAIAEMQRRHPGAHYFVFTDDPEWVKRQASLPHGSTLVSHNVGVADAEDLRLMMHCNHFVIANSTFSWWGAWLSQAKDKQVIAPVPWFPPPHRMEAGLVPASWQRM